MSRQPTPPAPITFRSATPDEFWAVAHLFAALHQFNAGLDAYFRLADDWQTLLHEHFARTWNAPGALWLLAWAGTPAAPVGLLLMEAHDDSPLFAERRWAELVALYVVPEQRGGELAHQLMDEAKQWARRHGFTRVQLYLTASNERAKRFYARCGLLPTQEIWRIELVPEPGIVPPPDPSRDQAVQAVHHVELGHHQLAMELSDYTPHLYLPRKERVMYLPYASRRHVEAICGAPALVIDQLGVSYPGAQDAAVRRVSLTIPVGVRAALLGANGSGKSTLLKAVAGLLRPQAGTIRIYGQPVGACHHRVAYLPQRGEVDWRFPITVARLVLAGRYVHMGWLRRPGPDDYERVTEVLAQLGLADLADRQISQLSGGQQQRALLARALVQEADLLLLDEPLSAVDAASREIIARVLDQLSRRGKTALVATHHLDRLTEEYDLFFTLEDGALMHTAQPMLELT
ncbi:MAG: GNAT family N-acetyltransferase [Oscillochloridaceae bacterium umkhey_bin13]